MKCRYVVIGVLASFSSMIMPSCSGAGCVAQAVTSMASDNEDYDTENWGDDVTRNINVSKFTAIESQLGIQVEYTVSSKPYCRVTAPERLFDYLDIKVEGSTLVARVNRKGTGAKSMSRVRVMAGSPYIKDIEASTGSNVKVEGSMVCSGSLEIEASTGASVVLSNVSAGEIEVSATTAGIINLNDISVSGEFEADASTGASVIVSGKCTKAELTSNTGASLDARGLKVRKGTAEASTGGSIKVSAKSSYNCTTSTGGSVSD